VATTPRQAVEAAFETLRLAAGFTCDQAETELLLAIARERGYSPLALCPCGKVVPVIDIPGLTEAVPREDRGVQKRSGTFCGACADRLAGAVTEVTRAA
jgi:hypothetical protein